MFPFCTSNVMRSVRTSHLLLSSGISRPSSARVSACSLMGSPRCDFTLIRKVTLPARTRCVSRQTISCRMSASGAVASVAFPLCPAHFLITHKTAVLSHSSRTSSLRPADCNTRDDVVDWYLIQSPLHHSAYASLDRVCTLRKVQTIRGCLGRRNRGRLLLFHDRFALVKKIAFFRLKSQIKS